MELKISPLRPAFSPSNSSSDSDHGEKQISEEDDDDRNHKHRRKETHFQSAEMGKWNKPFDNGYFDRETDPATLEKEHILRFDKRRGVPSFSRASQVANQRTISSRIGRGMEIGGWAQHDLRLMSVDIAPQLIQQGSTVPSFLTGKGLPNVHDAKTSSWATFGMVPHIPNVGLDIFHHRGLPLNPSMGMGFPRQKCRDFEERGFCLRGDMCPMEHGVNRIVVEDVQSLSKLNLPVSVPSAHMMRTVGQGAISATCPSGSFVNCRALHIKPEIMDEGLELSGEPLGCSLPGGSDGYDPDQPLWRSDDPETSPAVLAANGLSVDDVGLTDHFSVGLSDQGRNNCSKNKEQAVENIDSKNKAEALENIFSKNKVEAVQNIDSITEASRILNGETENTGRQITDPFSKSQSNVECNMRKCVQKALYTLFVTGIPQKDNTTEALFAHFRKFGEIINIYIPKRKGRAFVQFSSREEAERALKAPDAVMGNRFIMLQWAKRDCIPEHILSNGYKAQRQENGVIPDSAPSYVYKGKDSVQSAVPRSFLAVPSVSDHKKSIVSNEAKDPPLSRKKLENLELLKEELRKKQEMLDLKRNEFRRQLDTFEKQAIDHKDDDHAAKRQKTGVSETLKAKTLNFILPDTVSVTQPSEAVVDGSNGSANSTVNTFSNSVSTLATPQPLISKPSFRPLAPLGEPYNFYNRFKLDNRPTAFKINPPIPNALANVDVLKEHFCSFGELSSVELEGGENQNELGTSILYARISFVSRRSAEKAFMNGKSCQGHTLQFKWLPANKSLKDGGIDEGASTALSLSSDPGFHPLALDASTTSLQKENVTGSCENERKRHTENGQEDLLVGEDSKSTSMMSGKKELV
ncbi:hypothetical protein DM860_005172 [Cuscuta australis]|uniref:Uncharacterized protein n=1 Tax=Cuscuta australis TaxID=267555 RepID=A0A328DSC7_9ASTE|nr:hypothetical protein DM860_005172 [Cuscuta australis]